MKIKKLFNRKIVFNIIFNILKIEFAFYYYQYQKGVIFDIAIMLSRENDSEEKIIEKLNDFLYFVKANTINFKYLDTISFKYLLYSAAGIDGPKAKLIAWEIFELFEIWVKFQPVHYKPNIGLERMYYPEVITKFYWWVLNFSNTNNLSNEQIIQLIHRKIYEFEKSQANSNAIYNMGLFAGLGVFIGLTYSYCPYFSN